MKNMNRRIGAYSLLAFAVAALGAWTVNLLATTVPVRQIGPFYTASMPFDSTNSGQLGCETKVFLVATADTVRIGQVVYQSSKNTVKHDTISANYNAVAGVVIGGTRTNNQASTALADTSTIAAIAGQRAIVCTRGRVYVLIDSQAGIAPGIAVKPSNRQGQAGRVATRGTAIDTFNRIIGRLVDTGIVSKAALIQLNVK